jgi:hypothetical protein
MHVDGCEEVRTHLHTMWNELATALRVWRLAVHIQSTVVMCKPKKYRHLRDFSKLLY